MDASNKTHRDILIQNVIACSVYLELNQKSHEASGQTEMQVLNDYACSFGPVTKSDVLTSLDILKAEIETWSD